MKLEKYTQDTLRVVALGGSSATTLREVTQKVDRGELNKALLRKAELDAQLKNAVLPAEVKIEEPRENS